MALRAWAPWQWIKRKHRTSCCLRWGKRRAWQKFIGVTRSRLVLSHSPSAVSSWSLNWLKRCSFLSRLYLLSLNWSIIRSVVTLHGYLYLSDLNHHKVCRFSPRLYVSPCVFFVILLFWHVSFLVYSPISLCLFILICGPGLCHFYLLSLPGMCLFLSLYPSHMACVFLRQFLMIFSKKRHMLLHTSKNFTTFALDFK